MAAVARAPSWTTWSVVELLSRKELALLCQLASSAEAILRQRLFSIDSQKFGTVGRSHDHFQRGRRSFLSFDRYTHEKHNIHTLWPCARWHTQLFTEYSVKNCSPSPPGDYRNRADLTWQWSCMSIFSAKDDMVRLQHLVSPHHQRSGYAAQNAFSFFREKEGKKEVGFAYLNVVTTWDPLKYSRNWLVTHVSRKLETTSNSIGI